MVGGGSIFSIQLTSLLDPSPKIWKLRFIGVPLSDSHKTNDFMNCYKKSFKSKWHGRSCTKCKTKIPILSTLGYGVRPVMKKNLENLLWSAAFKVESRTTLQGRSTTWFQISWFSAFSETGMFIDQVIGPSEIPLPHFPPILLRSPNKFYDLAG